jgi:hypothetical protein
MGSAFKSKQTGRKNWKPDSVDQSNECFIEVRASHDCDVLVSAQETSNTRYTTYCVIRTMYYAK